MDQPDPSQLEALVASLMEPIKAKNALIADLEREVAALRERLAGARPN